MLPQTVALAADDQMVIHQLVHVQLENVSALWPRYHAQFLLCYAGPYCNNGHIITSAPQEEEEEEEEDM